MTILTSPSLHDYKHTHIFQTILTIYLCGTFGLLLLKNQQIVRYIMTIGLLYLLYLYRHPYICRFQLDHKEHTKMHGYIIHIKTKDHLLSYKVNYFMYLRASASKTDYLIGNQYRKWLRLDIHDDIPDEHIKRYIPERK